MAEPTGALAAMVMGCCGTAAASWTTARSLVGCCTIRLARTRVPPEVRLVDPIRNCRLVALMPETQCLAVTTQVLVISDAPHLWLPVSDCMDAMNEYVWVAVVPPTMSGWAGRWAAEAEAGTARAADTATDRNKATMSFLAIAPPLARGTGREDTDALVPSVGLGRVSRLTYFFMIRQALSVYDMDEPIAGNAASLGRSHLALLALFSSGRLAGFAVSAVWDAAARQRSGASHNRWRLSRRPCLRADSMPVSGSKQG